MIEQLLKLKTIEDVHDIAGIDVDEMFKEYFFEIHDKSLALMRRIFIFRTS
ncbi:hypothetical protein N9B72_02255 [Bacteriovoracaceae bacterium]|nr:hypothetical protein [Bacteriovoracaceae bacterium]